MRRTASRLESVGTMATTTPVGLDGPSPVTITEMQNANLDCGDEENVKLRSQVNSAGEVNDLLLTSA